MTPLAVAGGLSFRALSAAASHTCGLTTGGVAFCWGRSTDGQLGTGTWGGPQGCIGEFCSTTPVAVAGGLRFAALTAGYVYACGLATDVTTYCWGYNASGQLGNGTRTSSNVPVKVAGQP